jgi:hypothetical protein
LVSLEQVGSRDAAQLLQSIVFVIDTVLPLLRRPPQSFVEELERDLRQLISTCSFLAVVHACIKYFFEALKPSKYFATSRFCIIHGCNADLCPDGRVFFYCFAFVVR